ncbi:MAG: hypothetical protein HY961_00365 [Ignavibacteriae bacterium]|nr:hypothetical protein [Ignavibacteriota bacterium]
MRTDNPTIIEEPTRSPAHPDEYYLFERYKQPGKKRLALAAYYAMRPFMPRNLQLALRRIYAKKQAQTSFPAWPIETILVDRANAKLRSCIQQDPAGKIPLINYWPGQARAAVTLTHDVEWDYGVRNIPRVRAVEQKYGFVSSWNFVPERYKFDKKIFDVLRAEGCEIGVHGLYHDGLKFSSRAIFEERLPKINAYLRGWDAVGFRSPATHRNPEWMPMIDAEYDSSFPDTDPFEPQSGGCCSIFPFFIKNMVELPITITQDHTLLEILQADSIDLWKKKASWLIENHGLVNIIVHPDYMLTEKNLKFYEEFLQFIASQNDLWIALPKDVAQWWRERAASSVTYMPGCEPKIHGPAREQGTVVWATLAGDAIDYQCATSSLLQTQ